MLVADVQEKELKKFKDDLKQEMKLLKLEVEMLPKDQRKEALKRKREEKEIEQTERVRKTRVACRCAEHVLFTDHGIVSCDFYSIRGKVFPLHYTRFCL